MRLLSWLSGLKSTSSNQRPKRGKPPGPRGQSSGVKLSVEALEDRCMPSFLGPVNYAVGSYPLAVVAADFNNDAILDLVNANTYGDSVSVLLGVGDGMFRPAQTFAAGYTPASLASGDFNADGNLDLATANSSGGDVSLLLGNGNGTFQPPLHVPIGYEPTAVGVGDFNADGKLDLGVTWIFPVLVGYDEDGNPIEDIEANATVLLGNGVGGFSEPITTWLGHGYLRSAAVADFNGDAFPDFAAVSMYGGFVSVLFNAGDGSGTLQGPTSFGGGGDSDALAAADVDGDGDMDLVTPNYGYYGNVVSVFLGDGLGGFEHDYYNVGSTPTSVVLGDFNRDAKLDIATANFVANNISVLLGQGNGTFSAAVNFPAGSSPYAIAAGDFNGDGWLDAATGNSPGNDVSVLINDQSWPPVPPPPPPSVSVNDVTVSEGNTGTVSATLIVSLSAPYGQPITVGYSTANGTATAGSDYAAASGTLTFAAGQTTKTITIAVLGDRSAEPTETFVVYLSAPTNAAIADAWSVCTILDDEPRISISDVTKKEGRKHTTLFTFTVTLSAAYDQAVTMSYSTVNGTATTGNNDYIAKTGTLTFAPGETTKTITIEVKGDRKKEANETFYLDLFGNSSHSLFTKNRGLGTILNDD